MSEKTNELDMINQFINLILNRLNYSNNLYIERKPYAALLSIKSIIRPLLASTKDTKVRNALRIWIKKVDEIEQITGTGATKTSSEANLWVKKNSVSLTLYEELEDTIWCALGDMGFFNRDKSGWGNRIIEMQEVDPLKARPTRRIIPAELSNDVITAQ